MRNGAGMRVALLAVSLLGTGCGHPDPPLDQDPASVRARESTLAKSKLPGAAGVGAALRVSDSATARRARESEATADPP